MHAPNEAARTAHSTEMSSGDSAGAPAASCHTPLAMVAASSATASACSQMSPTARAVFCPDPLAVDLNSCKPMHLL